MPRAIFASALVVLVFAVPSSARVGSGKLGINASDGIYTMNADGSGLTLIRAAPPSCQQRCSRPTPRWSPDGSLIAFVEDGDLKVMDAAGGHARTVVRAEVELGPQAWSPDSKELVFGTQYGLRAVSVEDATVRSVVDEPAFDPAWSPTGSSIAYVGNNGELRQVDAAGGTPTTLSGQTMGRPTWSPDGRHIAFVRFAASIWTVDPDGAGLHQINAGGEWPHVPAHRAWPAWSPDGRKLLFTKEWSYDEWTRAADVYEVDIATLAATRLTFDGLAGGASWGGAWSPDGSWITTQRAGGRAMNADGTCARDLPGARGEIFWQPGAESPPRERSTCHALRVTGTSKSVGRATAQLTVTITNSGTEPLTGVRLGRLSGTDFTPTAVRSQRASCSLRRGPGLCRVGSLRAGESVRVTIRADVRRVTEAGGSFTRVGARANEALTDPDASSSPFSPSLFRCWTRTPGGGLVLGSEYGELICGRRGRDRIEPMAGGDRIRAGAGNDLVFARDNELDIVSCGPGRDRVYADRRDVVSRDCEQVRRTG